MADAGGKLGPEKGVAVIGKRRTKLNFNPGSNRKIDGFDLGDRCSVVLGNDLNPSIPGPDHQTPPRREHRAGDHPKAVAQ